MQAPTRVPKPEEQSTASTAIVLLSKVLKSDQQVAAAGTAAESAREAESALQMRLALKVARTGEQTEQTEQPPEAEGPKGTWIERALPRPPLVATMLQEAPSNELLANDSLGG